MTFSSPFHERCDLPGTFILPRKARDNSELRAGYSLMAGRNAGPPMKSPVRDQTKNNTSPNL